MSFVDTRKCDMSRWSGSSDRCKWCDKILTNGNNNWHSRKCARAFKVNHVYSTSRKAAISSALVVCGCDHSPKKRHVVCSSCGLCEYVTSDITCHHLTPRGGDSSNVSCLHHQNNLVVLCRTCHDLVHAKENFMVVSKEPKWGPSGKVVYERTYSRIKPNGRAETWSDTANRVASGNVSFVEERHIRPGEAEEISSSIFNFNLLPAGRHLWTTGAGGKTFSNNCWSSGYTKDIEEHFTFLFLRLMEGGGVGSNYSSEYVSKFKPKRRVEVYIVCDPSHPDYSEMDEAGLLSNKFSPDWSGSIPVEDTREGWAEAVADLLRASDKRTKHAKRVYDVSRVRWRGARLKTFGGTASGPAPLATALLNIASVVNNRYCDGGSYTPLDFMEIDHYLAECVVSGGVRRSARMSMLPWNDPYILDFIACKSKVGLHWTTNISVIIDNEFILKLDEGDPEAQDVYLRTLNGALLNGEPGFWNISLSNEGEPNVINVTNPCGEIGLRSWEACCLGHVNLDSFVSEDGKLDREGLIDAHKLMTRFLIRATFPEQADPKSNAVISEDRRIGVGHLGFAGMCNKLGIKFSESWKSEKIREILIDCYRAVREEARRYASELRIPEPIKVTAIAPTGTIAKLCGRTEGIHPPYAKYFIRRVRFSTIDEAQMKKVREYEAEGYHVEPCVYAPNTVVVSFPTKETLVQELEDMGLDPDIVESVDEISLEDMLEVQAMYQELYADNAVSYTVNIAEEKYTVDELASILVDYLHRVKGTTIMVDGSRPQSPYERITKEQYESMVGGSVDSSSEEECSKSSCPIR